MFVSLSNLIILKEIHLGERFSTSDVLESIDRYSDDCKSYYLPAQQVGSSVLEHIQSGCTRG